MSSGISKSEQTLKKALGLQTLIYKENRDGYINTGRVYEADHGNRIFVKFNDSDQARVIFDGEVYSLDALRKTDTVRVPMSIKVIDQRPNGVMHAMEFLDITELSTYEAKLGEQVARQNIDAIQQAKRTEQVIGGNNVDTVERFGFDVTTCCGSIPLYVTWNDDWPTFYARLVHYRISLIAKDCGDRDVIDLWSQLLPTVPDFFRGVDVKPSLLHGDLHRFNTGQTTTGPVVFDPSCIYGHWEYDLAFGAVFPGFGDQFYKAYFNVMPKTDGFETRVKLYSLTHLLNYWNHFGCARKEETISIMKALLDTKTLS